MWVVIAADCCRVENSKYELDTPSLAVTLTTNAEGKQQDSPDYQYDP
jgi:hypothetical protein